MIFVNLWVAIKWNKDYSEHLVEKYYKITQEAYPTENWLEYKADFIDKN